MKSFFTYTYRYKWIIASILLAASLFLGFRASRIMVENKLESWFPQDDPTIAAYQHFFETFGNDEVVITLIRDSLPYYAPERLQSIDTIARLIEISGLVERVLCISNVPLTYNSNESTLRKKWANGMSPSPEYIQKSFTHSRINNRYLGKTDDCAVMYTWMKNAGNFEENRQMVLSLIDSISSANVLSKKAIVAHGGVGVIFQGVNDSTRNNTGFIILGSFVLSITLIWIFTHSLSATFLTQLVIGLSNLCMFGIAQMTGRSINMVMLALPPLLMVIGVANMIHIVQHYRYEFQKSPLQPINIPVWLSGIYTPILFTTLTTAAGFGSLIWVSMQITRDYGMFAAIGVVVTMVFSFTAALFLKKSAFASPENRIDKKLHKLVYQILWFSTNHRKPIIVFSIFVTFLSLGGIYLVKTDTFTLDFMSRKQKAYRDHLFLEAELNQYVPIEFIVSDLSMSWRTKEFMEKMHKFQEVLENEQITGKTFSIANIVQNAYDDTYIPLLERNISRGYSQNKLNIITSKINQLPEIRHLVQSDSCIRFTATVKMMSAKNFVKTSEKVVRIFNTIFEGDAKITPSGYLPMYGKLTQQVLHDQMYSMIMALLLIVVLMGIVLRSWRMLLLALPINIIPIIILLGVMGFFGIPLDIATVTVAASIFGIIVDDTMHVLYSTKQITKTISSPDEAFARAVSKTGTAILSTGIILVAGYGLVAMGSVPLISITGILMLLTIVVALAADLVLLPALLPMFGLVKKQLK